MKLLFMKIMNRFLLINVMSKTKVLHLSEELPCGDGIVYKHHKH